ncbi:Translation initiation factor IF-3 [Carex littledalei]|uniref:Translation initiation factor IF-3 n=1 Tax=Carex littledalei TaxID=544730 RepID=A0A833QG79_9POAL|nr:Translation initiation factor IF-3 [Carex littledalei]
MAMWYRVGSNRLRPFTLLLSNRLSVIPATSPSSKPPLVYAAPILAFIQLRSFAAPVQAKPKTKSSESTSGPRLNGAITAPVVRLVTEDGHTVLSMREALDRARRLDLDLVEVQRAANPPVCKIMDFHKEKYKKEISEKERAKTKSALSLRSGEKKEVRFKAKTELNDLKVKAEVITRLMERGYRVKCTALPSGTQEEELGKHLSRLLALIKDVSFVESGPHVDSKHAYAIVRHIKFETKKSGKKKVADNPKASPSPKPADEPADEPDEEWECDSESDDATPTNSKTEEILNKPALGSVKEELPKTETNRYAVRTEPQKHTSNQPIAPNNYRDYNGRDNSFNQGRFAPSNSTEFNNRDGFNKGRIAPSNPRDFNYRDGHNQERVAMNNSQGNNSRDAFNQGRGQFHNREMQFRPNTQTFRPPNLGQSRNEGPPPVTNNPSYNPHSHQKSSGVFSIPKNNATDNTSAPIKPKFGIFNSSTKSTESSEKTGSSDSSSPMPKFGNFGANRTNLPNNQG